MISIWGTASSYRGLGYQDSGVKQVVIWKLDEKSTRQEVFGWCAAVEKLEILSFKVHMDPGFTEIKSSERNAQVRILILFYLAPSSMYSLLLQI